jgi:hypothetical protein
MALIDVARNHARAWESETSFQDALELPGWERYSTWGYDAAIGSYFALLSRNSASSGEDAEIWLSGVAPCYPHADCLVPLIAQATRREPAAVVRSMGTLDPNAVLRAPQQITATAIRKTEDLARDPARELGRGHCIALAWLTGRSRSAPASAVPLLAPMPSAEDVDAERQFTSGALYNTPGDYAGEVVGIEEALLWAIDPHGRDL